MSVTHPDAVRNAIADTVLALIDAGAGNGKLVLLTAGDVEVATLTFAKPAFLPAVAGVATADTITADASATGGIMAKAIFTDSDDNEVIACSVSATGGSGDIQFNSVTVVATQEVSMASLTYEAPV